MSDPFVFHIDIEPTNRCNADCYFCPRDQTPHEGLMTQETFDLALDRTVEFRDAMLEAFPDREIIVQVHLCGLGEPLLNKRTPDFIKAVTDAGLICTLTTNGSTLDERRRQAVLDAGVQSLEINVAEIDDEYEKIYGLPFERTKENVTEFLREAPDDVRVQIVLVNHRRDADHMRDMVKYWQSLGATKFLPFDVINRGGSLFATGDQDSELHRQAADLFVEAGVEQPGCVTPFVGQFIGYDGNYYLCCSDWRKEVILGNVADHKIADVTAGKLRAVLDREPICKACNLDPRNMLVEALQAAADGDLTAVSVEQSLTDQVNRHAMTVELSEGMQRVSTTGASKRRIPVRVEVPGTS